MVGEIIIGIVGITAGSGASTIVGDACKRVVKKPKHWYGFIPITLGITALSAVAYDIAYTQAVKDAKQIKAAIDDFRCMLKPDKDCPDEEDEEKI